jgi:organic radical activating enzyme
MTTGEIIEVVKRLYTGTVVITGGEPLTQPLMALLCQLLHLNPDILIGIETNGTQPISDLKILGSSLTLSISPKVKRRRMAIDENDLMAFRGVSLKILYPWYNDVTAQEFLTYPAVWKGIQPITKSDGLYSTAVVTDVLYHLPSEWRLSMQLHKLLNIR